MFNQFDKFLKAQLWVGIPTHLNWALVIPLVHKLQGELWTASLIAVYFVLQQVAMLSIKLFKGMSLRNTYLGNNIGSLAMAGAMALYLYGYQEWFLISETVIGMAFVIFGAVHRINLQLYMIDVYDKDIIAEYKVYKEMRKSLGSLIGFGIVALVYNHLDTVESMWCCLASTLLVLVVKHWNWYVHYRDKR